MVRPFTTSQSLFATLCVSFYYWVANWYTMYSEDRQKKNARNEVRDLPFDHSFHPFMRAREIKKLSSGNASSRDKHFLALDFLSPLAISYSWYLPGVFFSSIVFLPRQANSRKLSL